MKFIIFPIMLFLVINCAKSGKGVQGDVPNQKPHPQNHSSNGNLQNITNVGFNLLTYNNLELNGCLKQDEGALLETIDNDNAWDNIKPVYDVDDGFKIYIAKKEDNISGKIDVNDINDFSSSDIILEFGGLYINNKNYLENKILRTYKISRGEFLEYNASQNSWTLPVYQGQRQINIKDNSISWQIVKRDLDEVLLKPVWWFRIHTSNNKYTSVAHYFARTDYDPNLLFSNVNCNDSGGRVFQEITFKDGKIKDDDFDIIFSIIRASYNNIRRLFPNDNFLPLIKNVPIILSSKKNIFNLSSLYTNSMDSDYFGFWININFITDNQLSLDNIRNIYLSSAKYFLKFQFFRMFPDMPDYLYTLFSNIILQKLIKDQFGANYWFWQIHNNTSEFTQNPDISSPIGLSDNKNAPAQKIYSLSLLFDEYLGIKDFLGVIQNLYSNYQASNLNPLEKFKTSLNDIISSDAKKYIDHIWPGWFETGNYIESLSPLTLKDSDFDGLPDYFEAHKSGYIDNIDSDNDGWTDYSEYIFNKDSLNSASHPDGIVADGFLGDWLELLPKQIYEDKNVESSFCPKSGDIKYYGAILKGSSIIIGASINQKAEKNDIAWEVQLKVGDTNFLLTSLTGEYGFQIKNVKDKSLIKNIIEPIPMGRYGREWQINKSDLNIDLKPDKIINIKISTYNKNNNNDFCDSTPWFFPLINK